MAENLFPHLAGSALGGDAGDAVHDRAVRRGNFRPGIVLGLALF